MVRPASWKPLSIPKINVFLKLPKTIGTGADMKNAVIVKSFRNGLTLYLDSDLDFGQLLEEVAGKFNESKEFFSDASVAVSFEGRELSFEEEDSLIETIRINSHLNITCIVGKDEEKNRIYGKALEEFRRKGTRKSLRDNSTGVPCAGTDPGDRIQHHCAGGCKSRFQCYCRRRYRCAGKPARECLRGRKRTARTLYCSA